MTPPNGEENRRVSDSPEACPYKVVGNRSQISTYIVKYLSLSVNIIL